MTANPPRECPHDDEWIVLTMSNTVRVRDRPLSYEPSAGWSSYGAATGGRRCTGSLQVVVVYGLECRPEAFVGAGMTGAGDARAVRCTRVEHGELHGW